MIKDVNKKCRMFSSVNKTNISITDIQSGKRIDYYNFDIPRFIEKKIKTGIGELFSKHGPLLDYQVILYKDKIKICWLLYILEDAEGMRNTVRLGPFLNDAVNEDEVRYFGHRMKLSLENVRILQNFYSKIPVYEENEIRNVFMLLTNLLKSPLDDIELIVENKEKDIPSANKYSSRFTQYDFAVSNYKEEARIMRLIENGDIQGLKREMERNTNDFNLPTRHRNDPLRNAKNLGFTLNSISARAALRGGLNPSLVHSISTKYAIEIEKQISVNNLNKLFIKIVIEYCNNVREYSLAGYSNVVKNAIINIRKNLSRRVSLSDIANKLHVNKAYLSRVFKKETGQNITDYIHETKIRESLVLVKSKAHDITDIAVMFGYYNTAYYSTLFKKIIGVSPREYQNQGILAQTSENQQ